MYCAVCATGKFVGRLICHPLFAHLRSSSIVTRNRPWSMTLQRLSSLLFSFSHKLKCKKNKIVNGSADWTISVPSNSLWFSADASNVRWQSHSMHPQIFTVKFSCMLTKLNAKLHAIQSNRWANYDIANRDQSLFEYGNGIVVIFGLTIWPPAKWWLN